MPGLIPFVVYVIVEGLVTVWLASVFGWSAVLGLYAVGLVVGILVMRQASLDAASRLRAGAGAAAPAHEAIGDSGLLFAGGVLFSVPGVFTDALGLVLLIPFTRRLVRRPMGTWLQGRLRRQGVSVVTTNVDGSNVTRVVPGDVIRGDVLDRRDEGPNAARPDSDGRGDPV